MVDEKELDMIEQANLAAARIEKANAEYKELVKRSEQIESMRVLGGRTSAGETIKPVSAEDKLAADLKNYWKGTALEKVFK